LCFTKEDKVTVYGSKGKIEFSVFDEVPIIPPMKKEIMKPLSHIPRTYNSIMYKKLKNNC
jgi:hypothetical protein